MQLVKIGHSGVMWALNSVAGVLIEESQMKTQRDNHEMTKAAIRMMQL